MRSDDELMVSIELLVSSGSGGGLTIAHVKEYVSGTCLRDDLNSEIYTRTRVQAKRTVLLAKRTALDLTRN